MSKFTDFGYTQAQIDEKFQQVLDTILTNEETKFYYDNGDGTAYFTDTGNDDVRTEGMSYGMMIALQLDDQAMFNKFWEMGEQVHVDHRRPNAWLLQVVSSTVRCF